MINNVLSSPFPCNKGVRQGCNLSPLLFNLYISDLESYLQSTDAGSITLANLKVQLLLFADDLVLLADSEAGLKKSMEHLDKFCKEWELRLNIKKTKVVIFNRPRKYQVPTFSIGNFIIETDTQYNYLGIILSGNGSLKPAVTTLANQTRKALFTLMRGAAKLSFPKPSLLCYLFDSLVRPVAEYGCEIWGHTKAEELEIIHRSFCKFAIGVPRTTSNLACYGELGRYTLDIRWKMALIKYWLRANTDWTVSPLVKDACTLAISDSLQWGNYIKDIFNNTGFSYVWLNPTYVDPNQVCAEIEQRLMDQFIQNWKADLLATSGKLRSYKLIKQVFKCEEYLELPSYLRVPVARLRTSSHSLRIETGRYRLPQPIPAEERFCWFCSNGSIEDEFHFLFNCNLYNHMEEKRDLIDHCLTLNSTFINLTNEDKWKFISLSTNTSLIFSFCIYVSAAFKLRRKSLE